MSANPVLAELVRGNAIENIHRGAICVCDADDNVVRALGDIDRNIFPRSAIKSIQALAMFKSGAIDKYGLHQGDIALACASHNAQQVHVDGVRAFLTKIGRAVDDLECGAHPPADRAARKALTATGDAPSAVHNNCSGKHAGMLAVAGALGVPHAGYVNPDHPVQQLVRDCVEEIIGEPLSTDRCGTDGCSIPTWAAPLRAFAHGFARLASGKGLATATALNANAILDAATARPQLIRGTDTLDTDLMNAFGGRLMLKIGAEGVFCGALRDRGWGFALKIDDGNFQAAECVVSNLLLAIAEPNGEEIAALEAYSAKMATNWRKIEVAHWRATGALVGLTS